MIRQLIRLLNNRLFPCRINNSVKQQQTGFNEHATVKPGIGILKSCNHSMKVRENISSQGDEGHNRVGNNQKRFAREHAGEI
jgi:hypothetical protein